MVHVVVWGVDGQVEGIRLQSMENNDAANNDTVVWVGTGEDGMVAASSARFLLYVDDMMCIGSTYSGKRW